MTDWITDRMPSGPRCGYSAPVLVTMTNEDTNVRQVVIDVWDNHSQTWDRCADIDGNPIGVSAWAEMPQPYQGSCRLKTIKSRRK